MSNLGVVTQKDNQFVAKIATYDLGKRYQFAGPLRGDDEQLAYQDLCYIRASAEGAPSHVDALCAMQTAAKLLRDEAKALARGGGYHAGRSGQLACAFPICRRWHHEKTNPRTPAPERAAC